MAGPPRGAGLPPGSGAPASGPARTGGCRRAGRARYVGSRGSGCQRSPCSCWGRLLQRCSAVPPPPNPATWPTAGPSHCYDTHPPAAAATFVLEIGSEELPPEDVMAAMEQLKCAGGQASGLSGWLEWLACCRHVLAQRGCWLLAATALRLWLSRAAPPTHPHPQPQGPCACAARPPAPGPRRRVSGGHAPPPVSHRAPAGGAAEQQRGAGAGPARQGGLHRRHRGRHPRSAGLLQEKWRDRCVEGGGRACTGRVGAGGDVGARSWRQRLPRRSLRLPGACPPANLPPPHARLQLRTASRRRTPRVWSMSGQKSSKWGGPRQRCVAAGPSRPQLSRALPAVACCVLHRAPVLCVPFRARPASFPPALLPPAGAD